MYIFLLPTIIYIYYYFIFNIDFFDYFALLGHHTTNELSTCMFSSNFSMCRDSNDSDTDQKVLSRYLGAAELPCTGLNSPLLSCINICKSLSIKGSTK